MGTIEKGVYIADAYFRLSREDGDKHESDSIVNQKALVKEFLKAHEDIHIYSEMVDDGFTGVNFERPAFGAMLEDIKSGRINCVIVKDLSRFGRNYIEAGRYIEQIFPYLGVRFIAINDNIDTGSDMNGSEEMLIPFKNLINDAYCRDISIKIRSHLDMKRKTGQYIGSFAPYGYKKSPDDKNRLIIDTKAASVVRQIFKWKLEGMSGAGIADKLNKLGILTPMDYKQSNGDRFQSGFRRKVFSNWQAGGVNNILQNELYTGVLLQGKTFSPNYKIRKRTKKDVKDWIRCENNHEPIISKEEFRMVQGLFESDTRVAPGEQALYPFSGIVKCGYCNGNMIRNTIPVKGKKYVYFVCAENKNGTGCTNRKRVSLERFETVVLRIINLQIMNLQIKRGFELSSGRECAGRMPYQGDLWEKLPENIMEKKQEAEKKKKYASAVYQDYKDGILTREEYRELKEDYHVEVDALQREIQAMEKEKKAMSLERRNKIQQMEKCMASGGFTEVPRELLLKLIREIRMYDKDRIEVVFLFQSEYGG